MPQHRHGSNCYSSAVDLISPTAGAGTIPSNPSPNPTALGASTGLTTRSAQSKSGFLKRVGGQFAGFAAVGVINTILSFLLYQILILRVSFWVAYTAGFVVVFFVSLAANAGLVFRTRVTARSGFYFLVVYLLNYSAGLAIIAVLIEWLHVPTQLAPIGAVCFLISFNFLGTRFAIASRR
jgi:putative flippase GtrA